MFDKKVRDFLDLKKCAGDFGIEIEMETKNPIPFLDNLENMWRFEEDGSLRGYSMELVLRNPVKFAKVEPIINTLKENLKAKKVEILNSIRAGIHIHLNMQEYTIADVYKFLICYYPLETVLLNKCGFGRQGNLFCLRASDAMGAIFALQGSLDRHNIYVLRTDNLRYSSLNIQSLFKYGSLEFRALATTPDLVGIVEYCTILNNIRDFSSKVEHPWKIVHDISYHGPSEWMKSVVGEEMYKYLMYDDLEQDIMYDVRNIQMVCNTLNEKLLQET